MSMIVATTFYVIRTPDWIAPLYVKSESETTRNPREALIFISEHEAKSFAMRFTSEHGLRMKAVSTGFPLTAP